MRHCQISFLDVRWSDLDVLDHVNNVVYLTYLENARVDWLAEHNAELREQGILLVVVQCNISYLASATYPSKLKVVTSLTTVGRTSMTLNQCVQDRAGDKVYCEADVTAVWLSRRSNKPVPVPDCIRRRAA